MQRDTKFCSLTYELPISSSGLVFKNAGSVHHYILESVEDIVWDWCKRNLSRSQKGYAEKVFIMRAALKEIYGMSGIVSCQ